MRDSGAALNAWQRATTARLARPLEIRLTHDCAAAMYGERDAADGLGEPLAVGVVSGRRGRRSAASFIQRVSGSHAFACAAGGRERPRPCTPGQWACAPWNPNLMHAQDKCQTRMPLGN